MTLDEALEVTRAEALHEIRKHFGNVDEFLQDCGERAEYTSRTVLEWLGY